MAKNYIIVGAGGLARELYHNLREKAARLTPPGEAPPECLGFLDDVKTEMPPGYPPVIGTVKGHKPRAEADYFLGVGIPEVRRRVALLFEGYEHLFPAWHWLWDGDRLAARSIAVGAGSLIEQGQVSCDAVIGRFALVSGIVGHDTRIGDYCEIAPGAAVSGGAVLEEGVQMGACSTVAPGVRIGVWSKISAGSAVMKDVPPCSFVVGVPGEVHEDFFLSPDEE